MQGGVRSARRQGREAQVSSPLPNREQVHRHAQMKEASLGQLGTELRNYKTIKEILRLTSQKLDNNISVILPTLSRPSDWQ